MKFILDAGHGGLINGVYQTKGKRSYFESLGHFYEGVYNREIVEKLIVMCDLWDIETYNLVPEQKDIKLSERIKREHSIYKKGDVLISIHCDAFSKESANGFSTFSYNHINNVSKALNKSYDDSNGCQLRNRGTRTANFYMLRKSKSKAVLIECGFMTNYNDVCYLKDEQNNIVEGIFNFMLNYK
jgi:N-acetylmuramoyl-L-alanine amidase